MILRNALLKSGSKPLFSKDNIVQYIYNKSLQNKEPQPSAALKVLKKCIQLTEQTQRSPLEKKITKISTQLQAFYAEPGAHSEIKALEDEIKGLKKEYQLEVKGKKNLFQAKATLNDAKGIMYKTLLKTAHIGNSLSSQIQKKLQYFTLLQTFLCPFLESYIQEKSKELGLKMVIDRPLVDEA